MQPESSFGAAESCMRGRGTATAYAATLLASLGSTVTHGDAASDADPATAWALSGAMALTGLADGAPQMCPVPLASCADGVIKALRSIVAEAPADALPAGSPLLGERAALAGLRRNGPISPGGHCRLLQAADGWFSVSLARASDWSDVPAWLEDESVVSWEGLTAAVAKRSVIPLVERARLLGLPASVSTLPKAASNAWYTATRHGAPSHAARRLRPPRVVDLSALWAGPLCTNLLHCLGAEVLKVESRTRPDGARSGPREFYDLLNAGKHSLALEFDTRGIERLQALIDWADIVVEASRPRALRQLGVVAEDCIARRRGLTWVSITGYGRDEPEGNWSAFGDDAAVAAGLSSLMQQVSGLALICGDAIADPLTGLHAALAALASHQGGGGRLVSITLRGVVAHCIAFDGPHDIAALRERWRTWTARAAPLASPPRALRFAGKARDLGADNDRMVEYREDTC